MEENGVDAYRKILSKEDFDEICRCCLSSAPVGSIFELTYEETQLVDIFYSLFGTQLDPKDDLPKKLCETCIGEIIHCYNFKKSYEASEAALQKIIAIEIEKLEAETKEPPKENSELDEKENQICSNNEESIEKKITRKKHGQFKGLACSCGETFTTKLEFHQHREVTDHNNPRTHPCKICGKLFTKYSIWQHTKTHEGIKRHRCDLCEKRFVSNKNLRLHMKLHTGERPYHCEFCDKTFIQPYSLKVHKRLHTGEKPFLCPMCGKQFTEKDNCDVHIRTHNREKSSLVAPTKKFVCDKCGRVFHSRTSYKLHLYKHGLGEGQVIEGDQHQCDICKKFYATLKGLSWHKTIHKEKKLLCTECGKGFHTKAGLLSHRTIHTGEKSHACEFCDKRFARPESLQKHRFIHTGEEPYACPSCPKKFKQNGNLNRHMMVHTSERPFVCEFCDKSFALKYSLHTHVRTHTGEKPHKCDECTDMFCDTRSLRRHKERKHQQI